MSDKSDFALLLKETMHHGFLYGIHRTICPNQGL